MTQKKLLHWKPVLLLAFFVLTTVGASIFAGDKVFADNTGPGGNQVLLEVQIESDVEFSAGTIAASDSFTVSGDGLKTQTVTAKKDSSSGGLNGVYKATAKFGFVGSTDISIKVCSSLLGTCKNFNPADTHSTSVKLTGVSSKGAGTGSSDSSNNDDSSSPQLECDALSFNPLKWFVCPMVDAAQAAVEGLTQGIDSLLTVNTCALFSTGSTCNSSGSVTTSSASQKQSSDGFYKAWNTFRIFAIGIIVIAGLIMIIAQAAGMEFLDAYTIRKILPRLLVAIIFISLSWPILQFLIDFTNYVGTGIRSIIYTPFNQIGTGKAGVVNLGDLAPTVGALVGGAAIASLGLVALGSFALTAFLAVMVGFGILLIRQVVIMMLVIMAPLAIACYILPNTNKAWTFWKDTLISMLVVFPIISAFIAMGRVFAVVMYNGSLGTAQVINNIGAFIAWFAPYFLLPFAFRIAGGAISTVAGIANDKTRGGFDRLKGVRQKGFQEHAGRKIESANRRVLQKRADWASTLQGTASEGGWARRKALGGLSRQVGGYNIQAAAGTKRAEVGKEIADITSSSDDTEVRALTVDRKNQKAHRNAQGQSVYNTLAGKEVSAAAVDSAYKRWGNDTFAQQAALSYEMRKASTEGEIQSVSDNYANLATGSWGQSDNQAMGTWVGSAFENQNQHLEFKNMAFEKNATGQKTGRMVMEQGGQKKFVDEIYEKRGSYPMAQMSSNTIEQLKHAHRDAVTAGDIDQQNKINAISETFMHQYGGGGGVAAFDPETNQPIPGAASGPNRQASTPGAAHVAERVRELAIQTGAYGTAPAGYHEPGHAPTPNQRPQS